MRKNLDKDGHSNSSLDSCKIRGADESIDEDEDNNGDRATPSKIDFNES